MKITKFISLPNFEVYIGHSIETPAGTGDGLTTHQRSQIALQRANEHFGTTIGEDAEAWAKNQQC